MNLPKSGASRWPAGRANSCSAKTRSSCPKLCPRCSKRGEPAIARRQGLRGVEVMPTIDCQVHAYERNHPGRPWAGTLVGPAEMTGDQMVAAMDAVGVDGAVLVSPFSMYRYDASYAFLVYAAHPTRFRLVKPVDTTDPGVADTIAGWAATPGAVGVRVF